MVEQFHKYYFNAKDCSNSYALYSKHTTFSVLMDLSERTFIERSFALQLLDVVRRNNRGTLFYFIFRNCKKCAVIIIVNITSENY